MLMKPEVSAGCHQTFSLVGGVWDETSCHKPESLGLQSLVIVSVELMYWTKNFITRVERQYLLIELAQEFGLLTPDPFSLELGGVWA